MQAADFSKHKTFRSPKYLKFVRSLPCCVCGANQGVEAHHTENGGMGMKGSDLFTIPLCSTHHREHDALGKITFYMNNNLDRWKVIAETMAKYLKQLVAA